MTDHKADTLAMLEQSTMQATLEHQAACIEAAQVHATLYLAEQQRIANLIAIVVGNYRDFDVTKRWNGPNDRQEFEEIREQIVEALGLS